MGDNVLNTSETTETINLELSKSRAVKIAVPFITNAGAKLLSNVIDTFSSRKTYKVRLLTRFDAESILAGVCELDALKSLSAYHSQRISIEIRRHDSLHAKCFIFDERAVVIGSSNLTQAAQTGNVELGFYSTSRTAVEAAAREFANCWDIALPIDAKWVENQDKALEPFRKRYQALRSELRSLTVLQSIRMPGANNFLMSLRQLLKKADSAKGVTKAWIEQEMLRAVKRDDTEKEARLNVDRRISFLKVLELVHEEAGTIKTTQIGRECCSDNKQLLGRMATTFPILVKSYCAIPASGYCTYKEIASIEPDPKVATDPSQVLRNAVHWLAAFGLLHEEKLGNSYRFRRKRSDLVNIVDAASV